jgi:hypothetical protein
MVQLNRVRVEHPDAFPLGAFAVSVSAYRDFDASKPGMEVQARDKDTGELIWIVDCLDGDPDAREKTFKVKITAPLQPVPPPVLPGTPFRPVEFEGLTVTAWVDDKLCHAPKPGAAHRCRAKQGVSLNAKAMKAPTVGVRPRTASGDTESRAA